jgi:hypothetical protein
MNRTTKMHQSRTEIDTDSERTSMPKEEFQNKVLRPVLKLQNDVIVSYFKSQIKGAAMPDFKMELDTFVRQRLQKDIATRNTLLGMVLGLLSEEELDIYFQDKSEIGKRIMDMLSQRITDQLTKDL